MKDYRKICGDCYDKEKNKGRYSSACNACADGGNSCLPSTQQAYRDLKYQYRNGIMKSGFVTSLSIQLKYSSGEQIWVVQRPLKYHSEYLNTFVEVPEGFETDLASVPRLPMLYLFWGGKAHTEAVLHDYLFRSDCVPSVSFMDANKVFLESMKSRGKPARIRYPMYYGVVVGSYLSYHRRFVDAKL